MLLRWKMSPSDVLERSFISDRTLRNIPAVVPALQTADSIRRCAAPEHRDSDWGQGQWEELVVGTDVCG